MEIGMLSHGELGLAIMTANQWCLKSLESENYLAWKLLSGKSAARDFWQISLASKDFEKSLSNVKAIADDVKSLYVSCHLRLQLLLASKTIISVYSCDKNFPSESWDENKSHKKVFKSESFFSHETLFDLHCSMTGKL